MSKTWRDAGFMNGPTCHPEGKALERRYGYNPWLHLRENFVHRFDGAWYVARGMCPVKPVGSRVSQEIRKDNDRWSLLRLWRRPWNR